MLQPSKTQWEKYYVDPGIDKLEKAINVNISEDHGRSTKVIYYNL